MAKLNVAIQTENEEEAQVETLNASVNWTYRN